MGCEIKFTGKDIEDMITSQVEDGLEKLGLDMKNTMVDKIYSDSPKNNPLFPYSRTGNLGESINVKIEEDSVTISSDCLYSTYVNNGTGIYAGNKPWKAYSPTLKRMVTVKGQKPKHFVEETVEEYEGKINEYFDIKDK